MKKILMLGLALPVIALAYSGGPPNGMTGAPGEGTCIGCHTGNSLNDAAGSLQIDGPLTYEPGETYTISVLLGHSGQSRWGFELTDLGVGSISSTDGNTQVSGNYIKQTSAGTFNGQSGSTVSWSFEWTAPESGTGNVTLYAAGNAANGNFSNSGDYIHTTSVTIEESTSLERALQPAALELKGNFPNPFNPSTQVVFSLAQGGPVMLEVYDLQGRLVERLAEGLLPAGEHSVSWNAAGLASGTYLARLTASGEQQVKTMQLLK